MDSLIFSFNDADFDLKAIHAFLSNTYWSPGVPYEVVQKAVSGSLCVGALLNGVQLGFARLVTDRATFAYLADVYVLPEQRGRGISRQMLERLFSHPDVLGLRRMMLATRDAHGLYEKFGFKALAAPDRFMELHRPNVYSAQPRSEA